MHRRKSLREDPTEVDKNAKKIALEQKAISLADANFGSESDQDRQQLLNSLEFSCAALELAAAYTKAPDKDLFEADTFEIKDYLNLFAEKKQNFSMVKLGCDPSIGSIFVALQITLNAIQKPEYGPEANDIVHLLTWFSTGEPIYLKLLSEIDNYSELIVESAVKLLSSYAIVSYNPGDKTFRVDRSIHETIKVCLKQPEKIFLDRIIVSFARNIPENIQHAISLWSHASEHQDIVELHHELIDKILDSLSCFGRRDEFVSFAEEQIEVVKKHFGFQPALIGKLKSKLAVVKSTDMIGHKAFATLQECSNQLLSKELCSMPLKSMTRSDLGFVIANVLKDSRSQQKAALKIFQEIKDARQTLVSEKYPDTLIAQAYVVLLQYELGKSSKELSIKQFRQILKELDKSSVSQGDSTILDIKNYVGCAFIREDMHDTGMEILEEVFHMRKRTLGPKHLDTIDTQRSIGLSLADTGVYTESLRILRLVLRAQEEVIGVTGLETYRTREMLAYVEIYSKTFDKFTIESRDQ